MLELLSDGRPHTSFELEQYSGSHRPNSRVAELRSPRGGGHDIRCSLEKAGGERSYVYRLVSLSGPEELEVVFPLSASGSSGPESEAATANDAASLSLPPHAAVDDGVSGSADERAPSAEPAAVEQLALLLDQAA